ncbi:hypothetical protein HBH53_149800 [Parastagonospora nodorum]|nr:hypothetical protein HBH53_149800 [Parastagonospora nodorum]KAH3966895.1 hypothetical protein HBH51_141210 [Parastagonospora nodorum]KAH4027011.1 hypothetical protein HBI09_147030 [Parastagonospora nodorum]KAH4118277.1 hypothetical protein HBH47_141760 [Parastagonospora nodorum]KAH4162638.1 hypothetical protein HBH43_162280 [Parastagonospora nodorum]
MASYSRLKLAPSRNLHTSQIRPAVKRLGSAVPHPKQSSQSFSGPKFVTAIHGQSLRYQQIHTGHAPQPVRRQNVALVRNLFSGEGKKVMLSSTAARCASKIGKEVDAHRVESLNGICLRNQALVDFKVPRLNEHLLTMRQYRGDNELVLLHLKRFLTLAESLSANRSWKDLNHSVYRAVHTDLYRSMIAGDLEYHYKGLIVKMEKLAASTSIELGDTIDDYYSGIPIDLSSKFWQVIIDNAKAAALRAKSAEEDIMDDSEDFAQKPIVLNKWDSAYQALHGSPQGYLFGSSTASLASFRDSLSSAPTIGTYQAAGTPAGTPAGMNSDDTAPITFDTVEELATQLVCDEYLQVCKEEMSYLEQCIRGEHSAIKTDMLKEMALGVSSVIRTSKQENFDISKFIELARPWLMAVETLHNNLSAWHSVAVPESVKALRADVTFIMDGCSAALKASMSSNTDSLEASPATATQTSAVTVQDVGDSSAGLDASSNSTGSTPTNNAHMSSSGVTNDAPITGQTSNALAQPTAALDPVVTLPSANEPFVAGSAPTVYSDAAILATSDDDILNSKGAYQLSSITGLFHIKSLFSHNNFSRIVAAQRAHLVNLLNNKCHIEFADVRFLRATCAYITESAKKPWWSWKHVADCAGLGQFRNDMFFWAEDHLTKLADVDQYHEARCLADEIEKMSNRLDGEQEATGGPRVVKQLKKRVRKV